ncbi:hypothetical protein C0J52_23250 [Blattella germanica]|nr:hypothetical protein C0J52_23250 [Blattella germanica]
MTISSLQYIHRTFWGRKHLMKVRFEHHSTKKERKQRNEEKITGRDARLLESPWGKKYS